MPARNGIVQVGSAAPVELTDGASVAGWVQNLSPRQVLHVVALAGGAAAPALPGAVGAPAWVALPPYGRIDGALSAGQWPAVSSPARVWGWAEVGAAASCHFAV